MATLSNGPQAAAICEAFGVDPTQCKSITLRLNSGDVARVEFGVYPTEGQVGMIADAINTVQFVEVDDDAG